MNRTLWILSVLCFLLLTPRSSRADEQPELPWDYDPYRVMIWIAGADTARVEEHLREPLLEFLDRDFAALWRTDVAAAPRGLTAMARRDLTSITYDSLTANDPVIALKRDHENAARIRFPSDLAEKVQRIRVAAEHAAEVAERGKAASNPTLHGAVARFEAVEGDLLTVQSLWSEEATEAVLLPRGMAIGLEPEPKLIELEVEGRVGAMLENYDKFFFVSLEDRGMGADVAARELDCLMRYPGPEIREIAGDAEEIPAAIARAVSNAFAPMVRVEDVGSREGQGRVRAGSLITAKNSPAAITVGDYLQPMIRKNDRMGEPMFLQVIDWTYLAVTEQSDSKVSMQIHSGRAGALAGRRNSRTERIALKVRTTRPATTLRLHAKGDPESPLVGYDVYERDLESDEMRLIGHTDWDGRLRVEKADSPMRLLYVKNGGAVLARLPLVPGLTEMETADLVGDDIRLQAEAYIRGVQNAIIDLVAIRSLLAARIRLRLENGEIDEATELLEALRQEPSYEKIANDMAVAQTVIKSSNRSEQRKIDTMFGETRTLLVKHISPSLIRTLETEVAAAKKKPPKDEPAPKAEPAPKDEAEEA
ncbi:hypothetical protein [Candidatus Laterigemmans baculatus]|uniref:hypothetical protein n=1 Tax=Candidatus Laterigemmans baculatus TaxID=2770505 RepID=UPI0013D9A216|nr:hypothetical protein [Candidatus Laterigemmans baculatus]